MAHSGRGGEPRLARLRFSPHGAEGAFLLARSKHLIAFCHLSIGGLRRRGAQLVADSPALLRPLPPALRPREIAALRDALKAFDRLFCSEEPGASVAVDVLGQLGKLKRMVEQLIGERLFLRRRFPAEPRLRAQLLWRGVSSHGLFPSVRADETDPFSCGVVTSSESRGHA